MGVRLLSSLQQVQLLVLQADDYNWPAILKGATLQERCMTESYMYVCRDQGLESRVQGFYS